VFWPRLEIFPSFVLSDLRRILFVGQNRLEMGETACLFGMNSGLEALVVGAWFDGEGGGLRASFFGRPLGIPVLGIWWQSV
jgi:hypothetical protein